MASRLFAALTCGLLLLLSTAETSAQKALVRDDLRNEAIRLETEFRRLAPNAASKPAQAWRADAAAALRGGNNKGALAAAAAAVIAEPRDGTNWLGFAQTALGVADATQDWSERYTSRDRATAAAYAAYDRARTRPEEAAALTLLGRAYQAREMWRPALDTYRLSLSANDNPRLRAIYTELREKHGFRVRDYKVDNDAATPRACFTFSDPLARGRVDFAQFVVVQGAQSPAITAEGQQLCVDGLKHGERYKIVLRQGLPSSVEEQLLKAADYDIYVRDRSPQVRFTGRNYVLPKTGQEGIPVVTVNTDKVEIDVFRIGDRSLGLTVRSEDFMKQLSESSAREIERQKGVKLWSGQLATRNELNRDVITAFPVTEAVPKLEPGVHVMTARVRRPAITGNADEEGGFGEDLVTQWFVVSDMGLTAFTGSDGLHVLARSLATAMPVSGVELRLIARNNEVLATLTTDAAGYARFDAGLARGTDGMAPALVAASDGKGDYGFLDVAASAFDLADRGVKGRLAPVGLDAFIASERGVYRPGETINVTTLLRDAAGKVVPNLPLTLVYKRPDGVEHRRAVVADQGAGGRAHSLALFSGAARGTWRVEAYADAKGKPIGEMRFLVEDYVPDRLDVVVASSSTTIAKGSAASVDVTARYLYGAPGADLAVSGEVSLAPATKTPLKGYEDYLVGLTDEKIEPVTKEIEEAGNTDAQGKATVAVTLPESEAQRPLEATIK
ncbi:MAG: MG2 domain-containing protein, partial [Bosea sp. (in: a-proteobacteria)]